ncbi:MAG: hypothetical protein P8X85_12900 [Desulfobacterales bacterium]|jgi:hypothetical protein
MHQNIKKLLTGALIFSFVFMFVGPALSGGGVTIVGTINDDSQIVDNAGVVYEVADNDMAEEVMEHVGKKLEVKGTVMEEEGSKMITITSYTVLEE